ncbi:MAG: hypothetical protein NT031_01410 [Planctomycetota bacterium]|nr:hypothetical protein [Planctomycetota bacterium]
MFWKLLAWIAGGAATYAAGDALTRKATGKHIHEHVYEWWCRLRDRILTWLQKNEKLQIAHVVGTVVEWVDGAMVQAKRIGDRVTFHVQAVDQRQRTYTVCTEEIDVEELLQSFPELAERRPVILDEYLS